MALVIDIITAVRNVRGEMNIPPSTTLDVSLHTPDMDVRQICEEQSDIILNLAKLKSIEIQDRPLRPKFCATAIASNVTIFVALEGIIDVSQESARLEKEIAKLNREMNGVAKKLSNENFLGKAPAQIVAKVRKQYEEFLEKQQKLTSTLERLKAIEL
jgi:valyl-tRNA synthetase